ncbi:MAG: DUF460 domain-containing protein [Candidatus Anstonellaceae archaeon]
MRTERKYIIVGIDPGTTVGFAVLDLRGRRIGGGSLLDGGSRSLVATIQRYGTPSLIACDVGEAPELAQKIASYFACRLFLPNRVVREEEKRAYARFQKISSAHERDAYVAAVLAHRAYANKLRQIDALEDLEGKDKEVVKHLVLKGYRLKDALLEVLAAEEQAAAPSVSPEKKIQAVNLEELRVRFALLARQNANLKLMVERLESEKSEAERRLRMAENEARQKMMRDREIQKLKARLEAALLRIRQLEGMLRKEEKQKEQKPASNQILNVDAEKIDLEALVMEYRKGRKIG